MSQSRADRTATRPKQLCSAYGCPLLGAMSGSTHGGNWLCFAHYGKDVGQFQRITSELHRVKWLLKAISDIRTRDQHVDYPAAFERIVHDLAMVNRNDLAWTQPETAEQWLVRLEAELAKIMAATAAQEHQQEALPLGATTAPA